MLERLHGLIEGINLSCHRFVLASQSLDTRESGFDCLLACSELLISLLKQGQGQVHRRCGRNGRRADGESQ